ncbi:MAG: hypothetical protein Q7R39_05110 [Dehalococcoidia bacterium]|nr:hypothetical protein [Dehalococcoidia bacterium]
MPEELGKIERPAVDDIKPGRKVYFVPLIFVPQEPPEDLSGIVERYWDQVESHISNLEAKLGGVNRIFHELAPVGGEDGAKAIQEMNKGSHKIANGRLEKGAELEPLEDAELLAEFMDWGRCLGIGFQSPKVFNHVYEAFTEVQKRRTEQLAKRLDEALKEGEVGMLLMREGHQVQFASDIQVFYVSPPALDEINRWLREHGREHGERG